MSDQAERLRTLVRQLHGGEPSHRGRVLTVTSGKGGVGKSSLAINLALAIQRMGWRVCLFDADLGLANVDVMLGLTPTEDLTEVLRQGFDLQRCLVEGPLGLQVISGGSGFYELANLSDPQLERLLGQLTRLDDLFDVLVIDTGAGISRTVLSFVLSSLESILVTTPEPTAITDAYGMAKVIFSRRPEGQVRLVVNQARDAAEARAVAERINLVARRFLGREMDLLGYLPFDLQVREAVQAQVPFVLANPHARVSRLVAAMAEQILGARSRPLGFSGLLERMAGVFR
ncbi:MinD/ParA family protein [Limnochorda pilosa]|uniref:Cobyrinic acid a,c-diamide synthase n=1 Tax=Limnochorda pilosa TaxID=1555112 RepID=A0A0K2SKZ0_LIMPI|nr:MinD/ParA family protein [Limnochorda pilosa]BAS27519.1 cobyrinic acid a,c-diamide synthase [Limnochorda pilosa]